MRMPGLRLGASLLSFRVFSRLSRGPTLPASERQSFMVDIGMLKSGL